MNQSCANYFEDDSIFKANDNFTFNEMSMHNNAKKPSTSIQKRKREVTDEPADTVTNITKVMELESCSLGTQEKRLLSSWNLPETVLEFYQKKGIVEMFPWQVECILTGNVLNAGNLVYSAPTSAGKTLVAEILIMQTIFEKQKKALVILPFISVVREKMFYFQEMLSGSGCRVEGYMGGHSPSTSFKNVSLAVCTIEKANSIINKMLEEKSLNNLGVVVVDELHLLGDSYRGYLLELLLTKLKYMSMSDNNINIQIVGMSATLPNLNVLSNWLDADLYKTDFRPIPLTEKFKCGKTIYNHQGKMLCELQPPVSDISDDSENVGYLCVETISNGHSVLIFCPTKAWCESLAMTLAIFFWKHGSSQSACVENTLGWMLRNQLDLKGLNEVLEHLKSCPVGLDEDLQKTVAYGVAFHHAGLTLEERDIVEGSFRQGVLRVLVATSTLSSGVNLPARRVIVRSPMSFGSVMDVLTYRQMIGRAGRMGVDTEGESILIGKPNERIVCQSLMSTSLKPIQSCLGRGKLSASLKRAILEVVASGVASSQEQVETYAGCTLLAATRDGNDEVETEDPINCCIQFLVENEFIRLQDGCTLYTATPLGQACLASSLPPDEGLALFKELQRARRCFVLETDLHIIYQVTPYSVSEQWTNIDWLNVLNMIETLPTSMKRVGELVGVEESFLVKVVRGTINTSCSSYRSKLSIHRRFYTALALQDLVDETSLTDVANKFNCNKGMLQSLQQSAATYAGMVTEFSRRLGWNSLELIVEQFQERLQFGVRRELCEIMRLSLLNGPRARVLYNAGYTSLSSIANANVNELESALLSVVPFQSRNKIAGETDYEAQERNAIQRVWVTGKADLTVTRAVEMLVEEARDCLQLELGVECVKWGEKVSSQSSVTQGNVVATTTLNIGLKKRKIEAITVENVKMNITKKEDSIKRPSIVAHTPEPSPVQQNKSVFISAVRSTPEAGASTINSDWFKSRISDDLFQTPLPKQIEKTETSQKKQTTKTSPDLFSESLTFDTQLNRVLDSEMLTSDDLGFFSDSSSPKCNQNVKVNGITDSFLQDVFDTSITTDNVKVSCKRKCNVKESPDVIPDSDESVSEHISTKRFKTNKKIKKLERASVRTRRMLDTIVAQCVHVDSEEEIASTPGSNTTAGLSLYSVNTRPHCCKMLSMDNDRQKLALPEASKTTSSINNEENNSQYDDTTVQDLLEEDREQLTINWDSVNVIDVTGNHSVFQAFCKEMKSYQTFGVSLGCRQQCLETKQMIGARFKNQKSEMKEKTAQLCKQDVVLSCVCVCCAANDCYYVNMEHTDGVRLDEKLQLLKDMFGCRKNFIQMYDVKSQLKLLKSVIDVAVLAHFQDLKVASWLLRSHSKPANITSLVTEYLPAAVNVTSMFGHVPGVTSPGMCHKSSITPKLRSSAECVLTYYLMHQLLQKLELVRVKDAFDNVEMPVAVCLVESELFGFKFDRQLVIETQSKINDLLEQLEAEARRFAGRSFGLSSHSDIAKVLYHELKLCPKIFLTDKRKKPSTGKEALEMLSGETEHRLPNIILQWRKLKAILTKVIYTLLQISEDRVHGSSETHTSTGRITMHEPNLQNIPRDFEVVVTQDCRVSLSIRQVFIADTDCLLLAADYCQLELRILAHMSRDQLLIDNINNTDDVFVSIAASVNNVDCNRVTDDQRQRAKQMCYGIIYGIGPQSLAQQLRIDDKEAFNFMDSFKNKFRGVKKFLTQSVEDCRKLGYVETLLGRRRYLPSINHANVAVKSEAERQAVNTRVQGSAADIAKTAMNKFRSLAKECGYTSTHLVLHLHDELVYQIPKDKCYEIGLLLKTTMEGTMKLEVPLPVKLKVGPSWGQLEAFQK